MHPEAIWLFDGKCALCHRGIQFTLRHERRPQIRFVAIQSDAGRVLAEHHGIDPEDPTTFLFIENGAALGQSDGVIALSRHLGGPARFLAILRIIPRPVRDAAYRALARNRYALFGQTKSCLVPGDNQRERFIL